MISLVTDTNILVSATIAKGKEFELLELAKTGKVRLVLSLEILKEFMEVLSRPKFDYPKILIEQISKHLLNISYLVFPNTKLEIIKRDPDDNKILECAIDGKTDYIISGDNHLLELKEFRGIKIIKTKEILRLISTIS